MTEKTPPLSEETKSELANYLSECRLLTLKASKGSFYQGYNDCVFYFDNRAAAFNFQELLQQHGYFKFEEKPASCGGTRVEFTGYNKIEFRNEIKNIVESNPDLKVFHAYKELTESKSRKDLFLSELESSYVLGEALKSGVLLEQVPREQDKIAVDDVQGFIYFRNSKQRDFAFNELRKAFPDLPQNALEKRTDSKRGDRTYYNIYVRDKDLLLALEKCVDKQVSPITASGTARTSRTPLGPNGRRILAEGTAPKRKEPALA